MDSDKLRYFITVSETGSLRKASEILRISPAALSKSIKLLEGETGLQLLAPSGRGIVVTEEGKEFARKGKPLVDGMNRLATEVRAGRTESGESLRLGSFEVFTTYFLGSLVKEIARPLLLRELIPGDMERKLLEREIDLAITYIPVPTTGVEHDQVTSIEMGIYSASSKLAKLPFEEIPFAIPVQPIAGSPNKVQGLDGWPDDQIPRNVRYRVTLMESAMELCRRGLAASYLPKFVVELHNRDMKTERELKEIKPPKKLGARKQAVYIARRKTDPEGEMHKKIARILRTCCAI